MENFTILGKIIHCIGPSETELIEDGYLLVEKGKISKIGNNSLFTSQDDNVIRLSNSQILIPGLIDTHIHAPQYPNVGLGSDKTLLDWLSTYTYPTEAKYKDLDYSNNVYRALVRKTLSYGTTTACYFGSLFRESTLALARAIDDGGQRALVGKINMIRLAPENYIETKQESIEETRKFISDIRSINQKLIMPIITPRFALSVDIELMLALSEIAKKEDVHIQSHISENIDEIELVHQQYNTDYATAYDNGGMLTNKTIMAHGVYLTDCELELLNKRGTTISHCPSSNIFLKSGFCDVKRIQKFGIDVGLGTDISGGACPSIIDAMRTAVETSIYLSKSKENYTCLTYLDVFYLATLGGAKALSLDEKIGNFEVGKEFDAIIVDMDVRDSSADYFDNCEAMELLQKFVFLGDDRNVKNVFVCGNKVK